MSTSAEPELAENNEKPPINLQVKVEKPQACVREVVVTIPQAEVSRYMSDAYDDLVPEAQVPGFRPGRAPRKLVEKQFRERVAEQVKGSLLMDSLSQVTESEEFNAISEPDFDYNAVEIPEEGDFIFQFSVEVRPEFDTPKWRGIALEKPVEDVSEDDVKESIDRILARYGTWEATDEPAAIGDRLVMTAAFSRDGKQLSALEEEQVTLEESLSFSDGKISDFGKKLKNAKEGDKVEAKVTLAESVEDEELRGKDIDATIEVIEVQKMETPELTEKLLEELGDFESKEELEEFVKDSLVRQAEYRTNQAVRESVVGQLADNASFELPETLVKRQTARELERKILELRRSGFDEDSLRRYVNATQQNAKAATENALREHFILEQIAEEEKLDADPADYDQEIALIAAQSDMPERRVRARLEKSGQMDALRNQIVERKVIELIVEEAKVTEKKLTKKDKEDESEFAVYHSVLATKNDDAIPEAKYEDNSVPTDQKEKDPED